MSLRDYEIGLEIDGRYQVSEDFYGVVMALMRNADSENLEKLKAAWPDVWAECERRYNAPGGLLVGEAVQVSTGVDPASFATHERREDGFYIDGQLVRAI